MQLVAYGAQDIYLTGNPQITFFKVVYRRHTNFSMETIEQTISGSSAASGSGTVTISRNGDLVYKVYVTCDDATAEAAVGNKLINNVELEIGGQKIDKQTTEWNQIWADLSTPESKAAGFQCMTGGCSEANTFGVGQIQVPLNFWFCRNPGLALPLIALQYHEVKLKCLWGAGVGTRKILCDYIYLDTDERRRFAQVSHEYLIEQIQEQTFGDTKSEKLNFNHPVKELIWTNQATADYATALLKLNGHDRFSSQQSEYFQLRQPLDYHTAVPGQNIVLSGRPELLSEPKTGTVVSGVDSITETPATSSPDEIAVGGALASLTDAGTAMVATNNSTNVLGQASAAGMGFVIKEASGSASITFKAGDIISVYHNDIDVDASTDSQRSHVYQVTNATGVLDLGGTDIQGVSVNRSMVVGNTHLGGNAAVAAGDKLIITLLARTQDPLSRTGSLAKKVNVYSFALKPEEHQPSGTCNFSRIDNAKLEFTGTQPNNSQTIYAVNYNVLRIMSGMGGLAYSN